MPQSPQNNLQPSPVTLLSTEREGNEITASHLLDVAVPTPFMTELPPMKTGQHLDKETQRRKKELRLLSLVILSKNMATGQKSLTS